MPVGLAEGLVVLFRLPFHKLLSIVVNRPEIMYDNPQPPSTIVHSEVINSAPPF